MAMDDFSKFLRRKNHQPIITQLILSPLLRINRVSKIKGFELNRCSFDGGAVPIGIFVARLKMNLTSLNSLLFKSYFPHKF